MTPFGIGGFSYSFGFRRRRERRSESGVRHGHRPSCGIRPPPSTLYTSPHVAGFGSALPRTARSRGFTDFDGIQPRVSDTAAQIASSPLRIPVSPPGQRDRDSTLRTIDRRTSTVPASRFAMAGTQHRKSRSQLRTWTEMAVRGTRCRHFATLSLLPTAVSHGNPVSARSRQVGREQAGHPLLRARPIDESGRASLPNAT